MALMDYQKFSKPVKIDKPRIPLKRSALKNKGSKLKQTPFTNKQGSQSKKTSFSSVTKDIIWKRDGKCCINCGLPVTVYYANSHYVPRCKGGLGIPENGMTHCQPCHDLWGKNNNGKDNGMDEKAKTHLRSKHDNWDSIELQYGSEKLKR